MARPSGWDILGLDGDPTPGVVESVQALAKEFGDFADDVQDAYHALNSFGADATALTWVGQTADAFKGQFGPLPGRLQKLYTSYSEASDALAAYWPKLQAAQTKADNALRQAQDAHADLQRATTSANNAAADLKTAQQNQAAAPNQQAVTDAQTAHDTAQTNLNNAKARMADLTEQANDAYNDRIDAAKTCASALSKAQGDGIHNKSWWDHVAEDLSEWGGEIAKVAGELAPVLMVIALATSWIPGVDVVTAALAEADNLVMLAGTAMSTIGAAMQGHWGDALLGVGMLGLAAIGAGGEAEALEGEAGALEGGAEALEGEEGTAARTAEGNGPANVEDDPVDVVTGWMLTDATDVDLPGTLPLQLRRAYASGYTTGRLFGPGWSSTLDQRISINTTGIHYAGDDAQRLDYPIPADDEQVLPVRGSRWPLVWDRETDEYRITDPWTGHTRHFAVVHYSNDTGHIRDLTAITDRNGNRINILRDQRGTPTAVEHPGYRVAVDTITTAAGPRISALRILDATGADTGTLAKQFRYDQRGRLTGVINSSGRTFTYEWDDANRITAWRDRTGYRYGYHYDHNGRVTRGEGTYLGGTFRYDPANRTTTYTNSLGHVTTYVYDEHGHVRTQTDALGHTIVTVTDPYGRALSRTDGHGSPVVYERDEAGDIHRVIERDGTVTELAYNDLHQVTTATGPDGATWRRSFDDRGNLLSITDPTGAVTGFDRIAGGALASITDATGATTAFETDRAGLPVAVTNPIGATTRAVRDAAGRVVRVLDPLGAATLLEWNDTGQPLSRTDPDGAVTRWRHDADGRLLQVIDPAGATTVFEPGPMGTLISRTGPDGVRHVFDYDSELNLLSVTNSSAGATWHYTYGATGQVMSETDFIGRTLSYEYDAAGRVIARTAGNGSRIRFERNVTGRVVARRTPEGDYTYTYDAAGRLTAASGPGTSSAYEYDEIGRTLAETVDGRTMRYDLDAAGRRVHRVTPSGAESVWSFDAAGRPASLDAGIGRLAFQFDVAGREITRLLGGGAALSSDYDPAGRLLAQQITAGTGLDPAGGFTPGGEPARAGIALSRSWMWRADGVPAEVRDSLRGNRVITSDIAGRVSAVSAQDWHESYAYDSFGNVITDETVTGDPAVAAGPLARRAGRTTNEHDDSGRLVRTVRRTLDGRRKVWEYSWDSQDRLVRATTPDHGTWCYTYDAIDRRTGKYRIEDDGTESEHTMFSWDGPRLAEQYSPADDGRSTVLTWDYDPGTFRPATQRRRTDAGTVGDAGQDEVDEAFHAIVTDLVGTPTELVTPDGRVVWHTTTTLWGRALSTSAEAGLDCPLRFPGQYHDAETGLHYNLNRYYDPDSAAYLTADPLGLAPAPNDHAYVPNPLTGFDPLGLGYEEATPSEKWTGQGEHPLEDKVANAIETAHPDLVEGMGRKTLREDGSIWSDHDVYGKDFVIEVASGKGAGKTAQIAERVLPTAGGSRVAVYGPKMGPHVTRGIEDLGVPVFKNLDDLVAWAGGGE